MSMENQKLNDALEGWENHECILPEIVRNSLITVLTVVSTGRDKES